MTANLLLPPAIFAAAKQCGTLMPLSAEFVFTERGLVEFCHAYNAILVSSGIAEAIADVPDSEVPDVLRRLAEALARAFGGAGILSAAVIPFVAKDT